MKAFFSSLLIASLSPSVFAADNPPQKKAPSTSKGSVIRTSTLNRNGAAKLRLQRKVLEKRKEELEERKSDLQKAHQEAAKAREYLEKAKLNHLAAKEETQRKLDLYLVGQSAFQQALQITAEAATALERALELIQKYRSTLTPVVVQEIEELNTCLDPNALSEPIASSSSQSIETEESEWSETQIQALIQEERARSLEKKRQRNQASSMSQVSTENPTPHHELDLAFYRWALKSHKETFFKLFEKNPEILFDDLKAMMKPIGGLIKSTKGGSSHFKAQLTDTHQLFSEVVSQSKNPSNQSSFSASVVKSHQTGHNKGFISSLSVTFVREHIFEKAGITPQVIFPEEFDAEQM